MPFWSKKGKERAPVQENEDNDPDRAVSYDVNDKGEFVRRPGYRLPKEEVQAYKQRWEEESNRRREIYLAMAKQDSNKCSPANLAAEEATLEAMLMYCESETVNWTKEEVQQYSPKNFATIAYVRKQLEVDCKHMHADCCNRKAGLDQRVGWAVRKLSGWDGKQPLEDLKLGMATGGSVIAGQIEDAPPPSYTEVAAPAYSDAVEVRKEKADFEKEE